MCGGGGGGGGGGGSQPAPAKVGAPTPIGVSGGRGGSGAPMSVTASGRRVSQRRQAGGNRQNYRVNLSVASANVGGDGSTGLNIPNTKG